MQVVIIKMHGGMSGAPVSEYETQYQGTGPKACPVMGAKQDWETYEEDMEDWIVKRWPNCVGMAHMRQHTHTMQAAIRSQSLATVVHGGKLAPPGRPTCEEKAAIQVAIQRQCKAIRTPKRQFAVPV